MRDEIKKIIQMVEQGTISAEQAIELFEAMGSFGSDHTSSATNPPPNWYNTIRSAVDSANEFARDALAGAYHTLKGYKGSEQKPPASESADEAATEPKPEASVDHADPQVNAGGHIVPLNIWFETSQGSELSFKVLSGSAFREEAVRELIQDKVDGDFFKTVMSSLTIAVTLAENGQTGTLISIESEQGDSLTISTD